MTSNDICLRVHKNQKEFFDSKNSFELNYRIKSLKKLKATIIKFEKNIVDALKLDLGKSYAESYMSEISIIYNEINYFLRNVKKWSKRKKVSSSLLNFFSTDYIQPNPYGVTLNISPWNYPFQLSISPIIGAISAGNTVVLKPSEHSPHTTAILETIINEAFSRGHVDVITGGPKTGKNLLELNWDYIFFTGSTEIGKIVASQAAKTLTPLTLELGGNNPCIVDKDVSIEIASKRIAWGKFLNCGQTCIAPNFIAVHEDVKDNFIQSLTKEIISTHGLDPKKSHFYSKIINLNHVERLSKLIKGYDLIHGGKYDKKLNYFEPTILEVKSVKDKILKDEIFGPILPLISYKNDEELNNILIEYKNPLAFYIFSNKLSYAKKIINTYSFGGGAIKDFILSLKLSTLKSITLMIYDTRHLLITTGLAGLGRALAEVGAVMIVGGNIAHQTRMMTTSIALETSRGDLSKALALGIILIFLSVLISLIGEKFKNNKLLTK